MAHQGLLVVICSPSGGGKDAVIRGLLKIFPRAIRFVTCLTREPRIGEKDGVEQHFISKTEFEEKIKRNEFIEYNFFAGHYYGTPKQELFNALNQYELVILRIDITGEQKLAKLGIPHLTIFIIPDSLEQVLKHLKKRNDLTEQEIQERLRVAKQEIEQGQKYEHTVINKENKLDETITAVANIIKQHLSPLVDSL